MFEIITKQCIKCSHIKPINEFCKRKSSKDGYRNYCKECNSILVVKRNKTYYEANKEKCAEINKAYRKLNSTKISEYQKAYQKAYYEEHKEEVANKNKIYWQTPIGKACMKNANHKRRTVIKEGDVTTTQILNLQNSASCCYWCGCKLKGKKVHIDHYIPISKGGKHIISNLVIACSGCNQSKRDKDPAEFAKSIGKLL